MKKMCIVAALILALAVPAMAADMSVSGSMRARGFYQDNPSGLTSASNDPAAETSRAWMDFRIRPEFKIKVNDNININTRVRIFGASNDSGNERFGQAAFALNGKNDNASWDRGWVGIKTPYGLLDIGRQTGGVWALDIFDTNQARDRIKYTMPIGNLTLIGIIEKNGEIDSQIVNRLPGPDGLLGTADDILSTAEDQDIDAYYAAGLYKMENITFGLLYGYLRNASVPNSMATTSIYLPYFNAKFGNYGLKGEAVFRNGEVEQDVPTVANPNLDISGEAVYIAGTGAWGPISAEIGYGWASGDSNPNDATREEGWTWGAEFTPLVVLTDVDSVLQAVSNAGGFGAQGFGYQVFYGQLGYNLTENLLIRGLIGYATVDDQQTRVDDEIGVEYDIHVEWKAMPNLLYGIYWGFLSTGDFFKGTAAAPQPNIDDTWTFYHKLEITF